MTNTGMFEDAERIEYLEKQNDFLKNKLRESINSKTIDTLETDIGIKDWHIKRLQEEIKELKAIDTVKTEAIDELKAQLEILKKELDILKNKN